MNRAMTNSLTHYLSRILMGTGMIIDNLIAMNVKNINSWRAPYDL